MGETAGGARGVSFPGHPQEWTKETHASLLCALTGGGEKGAPALTEQEWDLPGVFMAISRLAHVPLRITLPPPHPACVLGFLVGP